MTQILFAEAADRNRHDILAVLRGWLPSAGLVLETASGTGQHALHCATHLPRLRWQPTEVSPEALASIEARRQQDGPDNLLPPLELDVTTPHWPVAACHAIVSINMIHATPFACCEGLLDGAGTTLVPGGALYLYGPFRVEGRFSTVSNERFDKALRLRDPSWGIRDLERVTQIAESHGLALECLEDTPINNLSVLLRRGR